MDKKYLPPFMIWIALTVSLCLFLFVSYTTNPTGHSAELPPLDLEQNLTLVIFSIVVLFASGLVPNLILKGAIKANNKEVGVQHVFIPFVIRMALNEAFLLFGFLIAGQQQNWKVMLPFFGVAMIRAFSFKPSQKNWQMWVEKCGGKLQS